MLERREREGKEREEGEGRGWGGGEWSHREPLKRHHCTYVFCCCFQLVLRVHKLERGRRRGRGEERYVIVALRPPLAAKRYQDYIHSKFVPCHSSLSRFHAGFGIETRHTRFGIETGHITSMGYLMFSSPLCSSALGPMNTSPSKPPAITRTCFGRPILH